MHLSFLASLVLLAFHAMVWAKPPDINPAQATSKLQEIMKMHATYKTLNPVVVKRGLQNYIEELDPAKSYLLEPDIEQWLNPSDQLLEQIQADFSKNQFNTFIEIQNVMTQAIMRRRELDKNIQPTSPVKKMTAKELKELPWAKNLEELKERLALIKGLQMEAANKLNEEYRERALQRIAKRQLKTEEDILNSQSRFKEEFMLSNVLKAFASALDTHTSYFTPDEAKQFLIGVQQRLFGIGAQLRDDINGFTVVKIVEGSPAANSKQLKVRDRIIAVNKEPVVGMDIVDVVEMIRGEEGTPVELTVIREEGEKEHKKEEKLDITIPRGQVVLKETRYEASVEPIGDGVIAYLRLHSFYQDQDSSSAEDLEKALDEIKKEYNVKGVILDLRSNVGGLLTQAVDVTGLFITKGIVVSIKDEDGAVQNLRDIDSKTIWEGPLIVLINRASASASEIVAQALQDYGRAIIIGDDHSFGKGSFQTFTLSASKPSGVNPQGEYKVTRGRYYTVSGKTPQLTGVLSEIVIPGIFSEMEVGEKYGKYPLENDQIKPNFDDDLSDVSFLQREKIRALYRFDLQPKLTIYNQYLDRLRKNSADRIAHNKNYQTFLAELKKEEEDIEQQPDEDTKQHADLQLNEAYNVMKDLLFLMQTGLGVEPKKVAAPPG